MMFHKLVNWIFSVPGSDRPYRWKFDFSWKQNNFHRKSLIDVQDETDLLKKKSRESMAEALKIISLDNWEVEKTCNEGVIYAQKHPQYGKIFKFVGTVNLPSRTLNELLYYNIETSPKWNSNLKEAKVLKTIDNCTNVAQFTCVDVPIITTRDFIHLRHWKKQGDDYVHSCVSVDYSGAPEPKHCVRGEQAFCTYVMSPIPGEPNKCKLTWLMQTNLKGWFPQYIIDHTLCTGIKNHAMNLNSVKLDGN